MATLTAKIVADFTTVLASELSVGGTTATLSSATDDDGVALPTGRYFFTVDGSNSSKEHISCTLTGTALTNIKTVSRQGVETAGTLRKHRIGASVSITDFAHILQINNLVNGTTNLDATDPLEYDGTATIITANQLATKAYVDGVAIAGAPDSSTSVKGIGQVSVAPASPTIPIFMGDNDPRVPTQGENDALVGTVGTPSSTNKYVTNDDTSATPAASKVVRFDANANLNADNLVMSGTCAETLAVGDPVASYFYQADNGALFDNKGMSTFSVASSGGTSTINLNITANSNRIAVVYVAFSASSSISGVTATCDGVAMTVRVNNFNPAASRYLYSFTILAPNSGASRPVVITFPNSGVSATGVAHVQTYYNVDQSVPFTSSTGSWSATATPTVEGAIYSSFYSGGTATLTANVFNNTQNNSNSATGYSGDSGIIVPKLSTSFTYSNQGSDAVLLTELKPVTAPTFGYITKTSASTTANACNKNKYDSFVGFVSAITGGGVLGTTATVKTNGIITGLSGLIPLATYYLSNTSGIISTSAGTNSKKIGIALTTTSLLIKHDN